MIKNLKQLALRMNKSLYRSQVLRDMLNEGDRSIDKECGYPDNVSVEDYLKIISRNGLASRANDILPSESWSVKPIVRETKDADATEFEKAWEKLVLDADVYNYLYRADVLSGVGSYGILLLGTSSGTLKTPLTKADELLYLKPFSEVSVDISQSEDNPNSPRFGKPTLYQVTVNATSEEPEPADGVKLMVHHTRVIHLADNRLSSDIFGVPRLQTVYNYLLDIKKILGGSGEMFWKGGFPGYSFEVNNDADGAELDPSTIKEEMELYSNGLQRYLAISGVSAKSLAPQVADPQNHVTTNVKAIAMALGIPYRIFLGTEEAALASSQDKSTWNTRIRKRQEGYLSPLVLRPFIDRLMDVGILPEVESYTIEWPDLNSPTDKDKAEIAKLRTEALGDYVQRDVSMVLSPKQFLHQIMDMDIELVDSILAESEDAQAHIEIPMTEAETKQMEQQEKLATEKIASDEKKAKAVASSKKENPPPGGSAAVRKSERKEPK